MSFLVETEPLLLELLTVLNIHHFIGAISVFPSGHLFLLPRYCVQPCTQPHAASESYAVKKV